MSKNVKLMTLVFFLLFNLFCYELLIKICIFEISKSNYTTISYNQIPI